MLLLDRFRHYPASSRGSRGALLSCRSHPVEAAVPLHEDGGMTASAPLDLPEHLFVCIDHVGVAVPDLDEAKRLYTDTFGMTVVHEETNEEQHVREAMVAVGDSGSCLQLLAPLDEQSTIAKFLDRSGPGLQQLAYRVTDVEQVCAVLRSRGVRLLYDAPRRGTAGSRINFVHPKDAGGVLVELVEPAAAH
jgi:methylmalonyl-CoA/ethylmalonyl-CoA epimerase